MPSTKNVIIIQESGHTYNTYDYLLQYCMLYSCLLIHVDKDDDIFSRSTEFKVFKPLALIRCFSFTDIENLKKIIRDENKDSKVNIYTYTLNADSADIKQKIADIFDDFNIRKAQDTKCLLIDSKDYLKFIKEELFRPNKLTEDEIKDICYEFCDLFIKRFHKQKPYVKIIKNLCNLGRDKSINNRSIISEKVRENLINIDNEISDYSFFNDTLADPLGKYRDIINRYYTFSGFYKDCWYLHRIYILSKELVTLKDEYNIKFWNWYKKTLDVLAIYYHELSDTFYVIQRPDEWRIENDVDMYYRYGNEITCFKNEIQVPAWLYMTPKDKLNPNDYANIRNADLKSIFLNKIGIEKMASKGKIVDTWENYPQNEMWKKSEYKLIDMSNLDIPSWVMPDRVTAIMSEYAPYLLMKNQTTGVYHMEGISPECHNLVDALKMRYKLQNLDDIEVKDIK